MYKPALLSVLIFFMSFNCHAKAKLIADEKEPVALIGLENVSEPNDGCSDRLGVFEVKDIAYDGVSEIVGGIRVKELDKALKEINPEQAPDLIRIKIDELSNAEIGWVSTLVKEGRKLLIAYSLCGSGGFQHARDIYRLDRLKW